MTGKRIANPSQQEQMHSHFCTLRDHLATVAYEWIEMTGYMDSQSLTFGNDEATDRVIRIFNNAMDSLEALRWVTAGDGTKSVPQMADFEYITRNEIAQIYHALTDLLTSHREA